MIKNVYLGQSLLDDICLTEMNSFYLSGIDIENTYHWFEQNLSSDPEEIARRSGKISALVDQTVLQTALKSQYDAARIVRRLKESHPSRPGILTGYALRLKILRTFIMSVEMLRNQFCKDNETIQSLFLPIYSLMDSREYTDAKARLQRVETLFSLPTDITIGINISEGGDSLQMCLMDLNRWEGKVHGIYNAQNELPNSLFGPIPFRIRNEIVHVESFIHSQLERALGTSLSKVNNILNPFPDEIIDRWILWAEELEVILAGVSLAQELLGRGYPLCIPECNREGLSARELYSSHMALCGSHRPFSFDVSAKRSSLSLITGANQSGKTSYIRTMGQSLLFAQLGFLVPAKQFSFTPQKSFLTLFAPGEILTRSRFEQEVRAMNSLVDIANESTTIFLNEPFTSTNPKEAEPLLREFILQLADSGATLFVVTHMYDIYQSLQDKTNIHVQSFVTRRRKEDRCYIYWVEERSPDGVSYAREIAREYGLTPQKLIGDEMLVAKVEDYLNSETPLT